MSEDFKRRPCFKHYCRLCRALEFVENKPGAPTPQCCGKHMAFLGHIEAIPGREEPKKK